MGIVDRIPVKEPGDGNRAPRTPIEAIHENDS